jgi:hypothetical protein
LKDRGPSRAGTSSETWVVERVDELRREIAALRRAQEP